MNILPSPRHAMVIWLACGALASILISGSATAQSATGSAGAALLQSREPEPDSPQARIARLSQAFELQQQDQQTAGPATLNRSADSSGVEFRLSDQPAGDTPAKRLPAPA